ncbi:hypothetical protein D3C73_1170680 [compost metagenome]
MRLVDQALPIAAVLEVETNCGATNPEIAIPVVFLGVPAFDEVQVKAAGVLQIGVCRCTRRFLGGRVALAVIIEQVFEQLFDVPLLTTFALSTALDEPRLVLARVQLFFAAVGAGPLAQVLSTGHRLQAVLILQAPKYFGTQTVFHGLAIHCARSGLVAASCCSRALRVRQMPERWGTSARTFGPRLPTGTLR